MTTLATNGDNDIYIEGRSFAMKSGIDAYAEIVTHTLRTLKGECVYDTDVGVPYMSTAFYGPGKQNRDAWGMAARAEVLKLPFVKNIVSFDYTFQDDVAGLRGYVVKYAMKIKTDLGEVEVDG